MTGRVVLIDLDPDQLAQLNELLGDLPYRHAVGLVRFFDNAYSQTQQRAADLLEEFQRLCAEAEAAKAMPSETVIH